MSYVIDILPASTLRIIFSGPVNLEELKSVRENVLTMVRTNELNSILCYLQNASLHVKSMELFSFAESNKRLYRNIRRTAIIYDPEIHDIRDLMAYSKTANYKGFRIKLFTKEPEALKWLKF